MIFRKKNESRSWTQKFQKSDGRPERKMDNVCHDIFRAIHEGKWLNIEYQNREGQVTKYWIGIRGLDPVKGTLSEIGRAHV